VIRSIAFGAFALLAAACGGSAPPPEDEVTETWTEGDDAPLQEDGAATDDAADQSEPTP
jgi:hypothetical protein